jgi:hypothetical protein
MDNITKPIKTQNNTSKSCALTAQFLLLVLIPVYLIFAVALRAAAYWLGSSKDLIY